MLFVVPLCLDTFAVAAALGMAGLPPRRRLRVSLAMSAFETAMPVVGLLLGRALGSAVGGAADYVAAALLAGLGSYLLVAGDEDEPVVPTGALALAALGVSVSLDELALGFTIGLLRLPLLLAIVLIGVQAFVAAQVGLRVGARLGESTREGAERLAAVALVGLAVLVLALRLA